MNAIELLNDIATEYTSGTKLHFQIRMKAKDYNNDIMKLHEASQAIVLRMRTEEFPADLIATLDTYSKYYDKSQVARFSWMFREDVTVLNAVAMPIGTIRDPYGASGIQNDDGEELSATTKFDLMLLGIALTAVLLLLIMICLYVRLRQEMFALEKEKVDRGGVMHRIWHR